MKIYLAGKVGHMDWRHEVVSGLRSALNESDLPIRERWPTLEGALFGQHDYVGPFFVSCDHSGFHGPNTHGMGAWNSKSDPTTNEPITDGMPLGAFCCGRTLPGRQQVVALCLDAIRRADLLIAWIDDPTCYGTIAEIGYARAYGVPVWIHGPEPYADLWFTYQLAECALFSDMPLLEGMADAIETMLDPDSPWMESLPQWVGARK